MRQVEAASQARLNPRILLLTLGTFALGTDAFVVAGLLPQIATDLSVSIEAAGQVVSAYALTYAIGSPLLAALAGRLPRERVVLWALAGFVLANIACAVAPSFSALMAARVAAGIAAGIFSPTAYMVAANLTAPERRGRALATVALGVSSSSVLGVPIGVVIGHAMGWHAAFWLVAGISALAVTALALGGLPRGDPAPIASLRERLAPLGRRRVLLTLLPQVLWSTASLMLYTYIAPLLRGAGWGQATIPMVLLVYGVGGLAGSQIGGRLADRFGAARPIVVCLALALVNQLILGFFAGGFFGLAALACWSLLAWAMWAPQQTRLIACEPRSPAVVLALANSALYLSAGLGAGLGALLLPVMPAADLPFVTAAMYVVALGAFLSTRSSGGA